VVDNRLSTTETMPERLPGVFWDNIGDDAPEESRTTNSLCALAGEIEREHANMARHGRLLTSKKLFDSIRQCIRRKDGIN
jgi:hypothetical protein